MRGTAIAAGVMALCASGAMAQSAVTLADNPLPAGVQVADGMMANELRLSQTLRLRVESSGYAPSHPGRSPLLDPYGLRRRLASTVDFYPLPDTGFHISFGMRTRSRPSRSATSGAIRPEMRKGLFIQNIVAPMLYRDNVKRKSPFVSMGWTAPLGERSGIRFDGGAMAVSGRKQTVTALSVADPSFGGRHAGGIGAIAQVSLIRRF